MTVNLEVLHVPDCPNVAPLLERLRQVTDLPIATRVIGTDADAAAFAMAGSPTLLINDRDPFATPGQDDVGYSCRVFRDEHGRPVPAPSVAQLRDALAAVARTPASDPTAGPITAGIGSCGGEPMRAGAELSQWRARARRMEPVDKAVHQAILRAFATTGHAPRRCDIDSVTAAAGRSPGDVLAALHDLDAIRLAPDGQIAVAYPFCANPTRHRVRIDDRVEVYAMCAVDALGMSPMLARDTRIDSVDVTSGRPVTITTTWGRTSWAPSGAVVFLVAGAGAGPSADCCCEDINFFCDEQAATAWKAAHPHITRPDRRSGGGRGTRSEALWPGAGTGLTGRPGMESGPADLHRRPGSL